MQHQYKSEMNSSQCLLTQGSVDAVTSDNLQLPLGYTYLTPSKVDQRQHETALSCCNDAESVSCSSNEFLENLMIHNVLRKRKLKPRSSV